MNYRPATLNPNSCIISSCLVDELDYVIGGYGNPSIEFLLSLNIFIESYVLASHFLIPHHEFEHISLTRKVLFPNGRPILEMLVSSGRLSHITLPGENIMQIVYVEEVEVINNEVAIKAVDDFCDKNYDKIRENLIISDLSRDIESIRNYSINFIGKEKIEFGGKNQVVIGESIRKPVDAVGKLYDNLTNINVQSAFPVFLYKQQIKELHKKTISNDVYRTLISLQGSRLNEASKYFGTELQVLPPLVSIVLSKARSREDIPRVIDELRNDFTDFRNCCEKLEKNLIDAITVKDQMDAIKEYQTYWAILVKKYSGDTSRFVFNFMDVVRQSDHEQAINSLVDGKSAEEILKDLNIGKIAGKATSLIWAKIKEGRILRKLKGVSNLWSLIESAPTVEGQIRDIERIFNNNMDRRRIASAFDYMGRLKADTGLKIISK